MNKGPNATIRLVRRQNHAGTIVSWTTVQREKNSHAYKLSSNVQTACSTDSLNNCPKHSILRFSSFALKIYLWLKMCQHNLPCSIVLPTACFPEGPSPHFTFCSFWRRMPRLEAVVKEHINPDMKKKIKKKLYQRSLAKNVDLKSSKRLYNIYACLTSQEHGILFYYIIKLLHLFHFNRVKQTQSGNLPAANCTWIISEMNPHYPSPSTLYRPPKQSSI